MFWQKKTSDTEESNAQDRGSYIISLPKEWVQDLELKEAAKSHLTSNQTPP